MEWGVLANCTALALPPESISTSIQEGILCPHKGKEMGSREQTSSKETGRQYHRDSCLSVCPDVLFTVESKWETVYVDRGAKENKGDMCSIQYLCEKVKEISF